MLFLKVVVLFEESDTEKNSKLREPNLKFHLKLLYFSVMDLFTNCKFHLLMQFFVIYSAFFFAFAHLLEQIFRPKYSEGHERGIR